MSDPKEQEQHQDSCKADEALEQVFEDYKRHQLERRS
jgi:hypothetical protein